MHLPVMTTDLARSIEEVDVAYTRSRLRGMQQVEGNPLGIEIKLTQMPGWLTCGT